MHAPVSTPSPPPLLLISLTSYSCTPLLDHPTPVPTPATHNSHSADARWKVTMHFLIQVHQSGTQCQSTSEMQPPSMRSSQHLDRNFQPRAFWITQVVFDLLSLTFSLSFLSLSLSVCTRMYVCVNIREMKFKSGLFWPNETVSYKFSPCYSCAGVMFGHVELMGLNVDIAI